MGQYQQWLFAQEIDRRLRAEIETLDTELLYLQDRITILEQAVPATENVILQALLTSLPDLASPEQQPGDTHREQKKHAAQEPLAWSELPRLETPRAPGEEAIPYRPGKYAREEMPADMLAFFDKRTQTDPQLSAWLQRERRKAAATDEDEHVVDEETRRLNENIQRWFERWHREVTGNAQSEEVENE